MDDDADAARWTRRSAGRGVHLREDSPRRRGAPSVDVSTAEPPETLGDAGDVRADGLSERDASAVDVLDHRGTHDDDAAPINGFDNPEDLTARFGARGKAWFMLVIGGEIAVDTFSSSAVSWLPISARRTSATRR